MINGNANDFIDKLSYEDHYVMFANKKYFLNGCQAEKDSFGKVISVRLEVYDLKNETTIFSVTKTTAYECLVAFEKAKIWNKKSFWEVEKDIEWVDC